MKKFLVSLILLLSLVQLGQAISKLSALRQSLFLGYDKLVKPDDPVQVHFGVNLLNLDICPHKQVWHLYNSSYFNSICYYCLEMYILSSWTYLDDQKPFHNIVKYMIILCIHITVLQYLLILVQLLIGNQIFQFCSLICILNIPINDTFAQCKIYVAPLFTDVINNFW